jgi:hypothetical protein
VPIAPPCEAALFDRLGPTSWRHFIFYGNSSLIDGALIFPMRILPAGLRDGRKVFADSNAICEPNAGKET